MSYSQWDNSKGPLLTAKNACLYNLHKIFFKKKNIYLDNSAI